MDLIRNQQILLVGIILILIVLFYYYQKNNPKEAGATILNVHSINKDRVSLVDDIKERGVPTKIMDAVTGSPIDLNRTDETAVFIGTGRGHDDMLVVYRDGKFVDIMDQIRGGLSSKAHTYASVSTDINNDGLTDLVVARENGIFLYLNRGRGRFEKSMIRKPERDTIPVSLTVTDYNKDGYADIYVSQKIHPRLVANVKGKARQHKRNVLLEGVGDVGVFEDVTHLTGTKGTNRDTSSAKWVDLDQDKLPDLVLAQDNGEVEIYKNTRGASGGKFIHGPEFYRMKVPSGLGHWTSVDSADYDLDGDSDVILGNDGSKIVGSNKNKNSQKGGSVRSSGDKYTKSQIVLRNDGKFNLTPKTIDDDENIGYSVVMDDLDFDGAQQAVLTRDSNGHNVLVDLNVDGIKDVLWLNVAGPARLLKTKNQNNSWIGVRLPDGTPFYNATVYVVSINDHTGKIRKQTKQNGNSNDSNQSKVMTYGLGNDNRILHLEVNTIYDGNRWIHPNPKINKIATFRSMLSNNYTAK